MNLQEIKDAITDLTDEEVIIFDNYESAFVGITMDNRSVYDYQKMIESLMVEEEMTWEEAVEWIDYNTLRSNAYLENSPIVIRVIEESSNVNTEGCTGNKITALTRDPQEGVS